MEQVNSADVTNHVDKDIGNIGIAKNRSIWFVNASILIWAWLQAKPDEFAQYIPKAFSAIFGHCTTKSTWHRNTLQVMLDSLVQKKSDSHEFFLCQNYLRVQSSEGPFPMSVAEKNSKRTCIVAKWELKTHKNFFFASDFTITYYVCIAKTNGVP